VDVFSRWGARQMTRTKRWVGLLGCWLALMSTVAHAGTHHYYYTDPQGNVLAKADAQGNIIARYDYAPYGAAVTASGMSAGPDGPGYTGHVNDPDTGLVYMQARYYDPNGRFLSADPVGPVPGNVYSFNRYDYANNNPVINIDPTGKTCVKIGKSDTYECKVDENKGNLTKSEVSTINEAYTTSVNALISNSNRTVNISVDGRSTTANAGDVAQQLIAATVKTSAASSDTRASTLGGGLTPGGAVGGHAVTTIFEHALQTDRTNQRRTEVGIELPLTFIHEGIHMLPSDSGMAPDYLRNPDRFNADHQQPYDDASSELFEQQIW
jgi:RHS repeat-associated protein